MARRRYIKRTEDGRYGLTGPDSYGYYTLWRIAGRNTYEAGAVADPDNIEYAADVADEEMASLLADARAEFGL
jgi:hypothetical protein